MGARRRRRLRHLAKGGGAEREREREPHGVEVNTDAAPAVAQQATAQRRGVVAERTRTGFCSPGPFFSTISFTTSFFLYYIIFFILLDSVFILCMGHCQ